MMTKPRTNYHRDFKEKLVELSHARDYAKKAGEEYEEEPEDCISKREQLFYSKMLTGARL